MPSPDIHAIRVWDLPTRIFHWVLASCIVCSVVSAKIGGAAMEWHIRFGMIVFALLFFRILWGLVGGHWSRFANFIYAPNTIIKYLRSGAPEGRHWDVGHNPLGSLSVFGLLAMLALQVATGLVADDEIATTGPLNRYVSNKIAGFASGWHKDYGQWILLTMVALHIGAIVYYLLRKNQNLIGPMISGDKNLAAGTPASRDGAAQRWLALAIAVAALAAAGWVWRLGG